jgi:uncharacterized pyridoxal phosphate-containing UPF0001 family protein
VAAAAPVARSVTRHGTPSLDVAGGVLEQLAPLCADLVQLDGCTAERPTSTPTAATAPPGASPAWRGWRRDRPGPARRAPAALAEVEARLSAACAAAGRPRESVTLVAVTKTRPASDVALLHGLGVLDVGESKDQEAAGKAQELAGLEPALRWHFVGRLQRNKARSVAGYADVVHSVDRAPLVDALAAGAARAGPRAGRAAAGQPGRRPDAGRRAAGRPPAPGRAVAAAPGLRCAGVMAVAPLGRRAARGVRPPGRVSHGLRSDHPAPAGSAPA